MHRIFEFDDYPQDRKQLFRRLDAIQRRFPRFRANLWGVPAWLDRDPEAMEEVDKRPWVYLGQHGFEHTKGECRLPRRYIPHLPGLGKDPRFEPWFKAPWFGTDGPFLWELEKRGIVVALRTLQGVRFPTPKARVYMAEDWRNNYRHRWRAYDFHPGELNGRFDRYEQTIQAKDRWLTIAQAARHARLKLHLGCGLHIFPGWVNLDPRAHLDRRIVRWSFDELIPYAANTADVVFTSHVFNYLDENRYAEALLDIWRVLRPGGVVRLSEDCTDAGYTWRRPGQRHTTGRILSRPTRAKIEAAMRRVGFTIFDADPERTVSPHRDVLQGNSRAKRYARGHKFYIEGVKLLYCPDLRHVHRWDPRAPENSRRGRYRLPE